MEWIERRGTIVRPASSPDVTPTDFSMWALLKDKAFSVKPQNLESLKELIAGYFDALFTLKLCKKCADQF